MPSSGQTKGVFEANIDAIESQEEPDISFKPPSRSIFLPRSTSSSSHQDRRNENESDHSLEMNAAQNLTLLKNSSLSELSTASTSVTTASKVSSNSSSPDEEVPYDAQLSVRNGELSETGKVIDRLLTAAYAMEDKQGSSDVTSLHSIKKEMSSSDERFVAVLAPINEMSVSPRTLKSSSVTESNNAALKSTASKSDSSDLNRGNDIENLVETQNENNGINKGKKRVTRTDAYGDYNCHTRNFLLASPSDCGSFKRSRIDSAFSVHTIKSSRAQMHS